MRAGPAETWRFHVSRQRPGFLRGGACLNDAPGSQRTSAGGVSCPGLRAAGGDGPSKLQGQLPQALSPVRPTLVCINTSLGEFAKGRSFPVLPPRKQCCPPLKGGRATPRPPLSPDIKITPLSRSCSRGGGTLPVTPGLRGAGALPGWLASEDTRRPV